MARSAVNLIDYSLNISKKYQNIYVLKSDNQISLKTPLEAGCVNFNLIYDLSIYKHGSDANIYSKELYGIDYRFEQMDLSELNQATDYYRDILEAIDNGRAYLRRRKLFSAYLLKTALVISDNIDSLKHKPNTVYSTEYLPIKFRLK